jgi:hypothetical protein
VRSFVPCLAVASLRNVPQTQLTPKLGGLPWGLPQDLWPSCRECTAPMAPLAQLPHQDAVLDFGQPPAVLHLFQCTTPGCSTWSPDGGCNAAFVLPLECIGQGPTPAPPAVKQGPAMHGELWLTGWPQHEDGIADELRACYLAVAPFYALPEPLRFPHQFDARLRTKADGTPCWTARGPSGMPPSFDYLMQIDNLIPYREPCRTRLKSVVMSACGAPAGAWRRARQRTLPGGITHPGAPCRTKARGRSILWSSRTSDRTARGICPSIAGRTRRVSSSSGIVDLRTVPCAACRLSQPRPEGCGPSVLPSGHRVLSGRLALRGSSLHP